MGVQKYLKGSRKLFHRSNNFFLMVDNFLVDWELILSIENFFCRSRIFCPLRIFCRSRIFLSIEKFLCSKFKGFEVGSTD